MVRLKGAAVSAPVRASVLVAARSVRGRAQLRIYRSWWATGGIVEPALTPYRYDDAALLLRAGRLLDEGLGVAKALGTARSELAETWSIGR